MDSYHRWMQVSALATLGGCPAVSVPAGFDGSGRPMGMQLIGRPRGDMAVLRAAAAYETTLPWLAGA
jgi:amidase